MIFCCHVDRLKVNKNINIIGEFLLARMNIAKITYSLFSSDAPVLKYIVSGCKQRSRDFSLSSKCFRQQTEEQRRKLKSTLNYVTAAGVVCVGLSYAAVPLYRIFCESYSFGGTVGIDSGDKVEGLQKVQSRPIKVRFNSDVGASMVWKFKPQQSEITVLPGETALAFYTATNPTDRTITGVSTYNVVPFEAGQYFNKIQCFCFEEQQLNPHEQVDMPVFFYIDPEITEDPQLELLDELTLSYTFFEAREGMKLPVPSYLKK